ncbi:MAG: hypothetical protein KY457_11990, partial [Actinobacteria bacterium]|nr:hypothetical protein [Actinomycetota bacterium]
TVAIDGFGWGHGVGMSQFGAKGKAENGMAYDDILGAYYGGLDPEVHDRAPRRVRVGLDWEDLSQVEVSADGPVRVFTDVAETATAPTLPWTFRAEGSTVDLVGRPPLTFGERTSETRRLPRADAAAEPPAVVAGPDAEPATPPASDEPRTAPGARAAVAAAAPASVADDVPSSGDGTGLAAAVAGTVQHTAPGVGGIVTLVRGVLRAFGG